MESEKFKPTYLYKRLGRHLGLLAVLVLLTCVACEEPLRLPYIEPALHNWPEEYQHCRFGEFELDALKGVLEFEN